MSGVNQSVAMNFSHIVLDCFIANTGSAGFYSEGDYLAKIFTSVNGDLSDASATRTCEWYNLITREVIADADVIPADIEYCGQQKVIDCELCDDVEGDESGEIISFRQCRLVNPITGSVIDLKAFELDWSAEYVPVGTVRDCSKIGTGMAECPKAEAVDGSWLSPVGVMSMVIHVLAVADPLNPPTITAGGEPAPVGVGSYDFRTCKCDNPFCADVTVTANAGDIVTVTWVELCVCEDC